MSLSFVRVFTQNKVRFLFVLFLAIILTLTLVTSRVRAQNNTDNQTNTPSNAVSGDPIYLKIDGIEGESTDKNHQGWILLDSFNLGFNGPRGASKASLQDGHFSMKVNKASPPLFLAVVSGKRYKSVVLVANNGRFDYVTWKFTDVVFQSYQQSSNGAVPEDQISFSFAKVEYEFRPNNSGEGGSPVKAVWDFVENKVF